MDDDLKNLESQLHRLRPAPPSRALRVRVDRELADTSERTAVAPLRWVWFAVLPAAGAPSDAPLKPITAENVLVSVCDEGLVTLEDGPPARRERLEFVDTITWKNPRTNSSLRWSVPHEEVRVVPIVFQ